MTDFRSRSARIPARHKRRYTISRHAIERFRERVDEEFRHRDDEDLSNLLDDRVCHAESTYQVRDPRAPDDITTLCSVACRHATYYAVVRNMAVVTLLDEEMARNNFDGQWSPILNAPFEVLRDLKLPALPTPPPLPALPAPAATPTAIAEDPLAPPQPPALPAPAATPTAIAEDPLAEAGVAYARARRQQRECQAWVAALKAELDRAATALLEAELAVEETHKRLIDLADGGEPT